MSDTNKIHRLLAKLIVGVIYTEHELWRRDHIQQYSYRIASTLGEHIDSEAFINFLVKMDVIKLDKVIDGVEWYRHNLPDTLGFAYRHDKK